MQRPSYTGILIAFGWLTTTCMWDTTEACSCMPTHPQTRYCQADFVILARIKREFVYNDTRVYKTRIRKEFKMSEKAQVALKSGRLITEAEESLCGVHLERGKLYVISGKVRSLRAHISLCGSTYDRWDTVSKRQKKGLNRMYKVGCTCNIKLCGGGRCPKRKDSCLWTTWDPDDRKDCHRMQGFCLRSASNQCMWVKNKPQLECLKNLTRPALPTPRPYKEGSPLTISRWSG